MLHRFHRRAQVLAVLAAAAALVVARPRDGHAEKSPLRTCTDNAWADYNECLMEYDSERHRTACDYDFMMSHELCHIKFWKDAFGGLL